ncbi:hypothetical protein [Lentzea cavernae]|uniref:Uncharacterized protein n=1 Tax=Lentzea cavernae TaxID=2020703 RepID=A0ABQ3MQA3_9PSEU|nr:hypothetical protein [Lentzea cavernae]GHH57614.1 hypothetical protein GCM10017774_77420 [Lentzea cavernae]
MGNDNATLIFRRVQPDKAKAEETRQERRRAARALASTFARDAQDCALLLDALGLTAAEGKARA